MTDLEWLKSTGLDQTILHFAAEDVARAVAKRESLLVAFAPGDMTNYSIMFSPPPARTSSLDGRLLLEPDDWLVSCVGPRGSSFAWKPWTPESGHSWWERGVLPPHTEKLLSVLLTFVQEAQRIEWKYRNND